MKCEWSAVNLIAVCRYCSGEFSLVNSLHFVDHHDYKLCVPKGFSVSRLLVSCMGPGDWLDDCNRPPCISSYSCHIHIQD